MKVVVLSASIRRGRKSHNVAKYLEQVISNDFKHDVEIFDLKEANFPLFEERLSHLEDPKEEYVAYANTIETCDALIVVCPEYNGDYPASFKNAFDFLYTQYEDKPVGIFSVSAGNLGGSQVMQKLWTLYTKVKAYVVGPGVYIPKVTDHFDDNGNTETDWMIKQCKNYLERVFSKVQ